MDWAALGGHMRRRFSSPQASSLAAFMTEGSEHLLAVREASGERERERGVEPRREGEEEEGERC